jgi:hypothetical protein
VAEPACLANRESDPQNLIAQGGGHGVRITIGGGGVKCMCDTFTHGLTKVNFCGPSPMC